MQILFHFGRVLWSGKMLWITFLQSLWLLWHQPEMNETLQTDWPVGHPLPCVLVCLCNISSHGYAASKLVFHLSLWEDVVVSKSYIKLLLLWSDGSLAFLKTDATCLLIMGGCCGPESPVTVKAFISKVLPPPWPWPWPGFLLGVDFCLPPPHPLPLFGCLSLNYPNLFCGLPWEGEWPVELFLLPELLHCWAQWFRWPHLLHVVPWAGQSPWLWEHQHLPQVFLGGTFWKDFDKALVWIRGLE